MKRYKIVKIYQSKRFSVIPLKPASKEPAIKWKKYQSQGPTAEEIKNMFGKDDEHNIGIVTGKISGIVVVDLDSPEAIQFSKDKNFPDTPTVETSKGLHLYFKYKKGVRNSQARSDLPDIDIRGNGGYVVAPPSIHPDGKRYKWVKGKSLQDIPFAELPECILAKKLDEKKPIKELLKGVSEGERNNSLARLTGYWAAKGKTFDKCMSRAMKWNRRNSQPLDDREVRKTVESIFNRHKKKNRPHRKNKDAVLRRLRDKFESPGYLLFSDHQSGEGWIKYKNKGHYAVRPIFSQHTEMLIRKAAWDRQCFLKKNEIKEMQEMLNTIAHLKGPTFKLHYRAAWYENRLWIDLGSDDWSVVKVSPSRWKIVRSKKAPTIFKRFSHTKALPVPVSGGKLDLLRPFIRIPSDSAWNLLQVWIIAAFVPNISRPGIILHGLQGSGKSSTAKILRTLIDPSVTPLLSLPSTHQELVQQLDHHYIIGLDNLQEIRPCDSDALCRAVTGGAFTKRKLYTDTDDVIFKFIRPFILNGINIPGSSPDLLDRSIMIQLGRIEADQRRAEQDIMNGFQKVHPRIFGAILDGISAAMKNRHSVKLEPLPRMADFAQWGYSIADHLGISGKGFLKLYAKNAMLQHNEVIDSDPVAQSIMNLAKAEGSFEGTPTELHQRCKEYLPEEETRDRSWPKAVAVFSKRFNRVIHNLQELGLNVEFSRQRERKIKIKYNPSK
jgi:hypothetical protein